MAQDIAEVIPNEKNIFKKRTDVWPVGAVNKKMVIFAEEGVQSHLIFDWLRNILERRPDQPVVYLYIARSGLAHPLNPEAILLEHTYPRFRAVSYFLRTEAAGDDSWLKTIPQSAEAHYYCSGSKPFMDRISSVLRKLNIQDEDIHTF